MCGIVSRRRLEEQPLPVSEEGLDAWHQRTAAAAFATFDHDKFGGSSTSGSASTLRDVLVALIGKEHRSAPAAARTGTAAAYRHNCSGIQARLLWHTGTTVVADRRDCCGTQAPLLWAAYLILEWQIVV